MHKYPPTDKFISKIMIQIYVIPFQGLMKWFDKNNL